MKMRFNRFLQCCLLICTAILLISPALASKKSTAQPLDKIVAIVDNSVITQSEFNQALETAQKSSTATSGDALRKQVLNQLIDRKLQLLLAEQSNIHVSDEDVSKAIENIARSNNMTADDLFKRLALEGMTQENYRREISEEMTLQRVQQQEIGSKISLTAQEVKSYMHSKTSSKPIVTEKEYHVIDTLVALPEPATQDDISRVQKQAIEMLAQLKQGKTPTATAETSDLGWRTLQEFPSAFLTPVSQLNAKEFAEPIQTANGFHLLHLVDVRKMAHQNGVPDLTEQQAQQMVYQRKMEDELKPWLAKLRSGAYINTHPDTP